MKFVCSIAQATEFGVLKTQAIRRVNNGMALAEGTPREAWHIHLHRDEKEKRPRRRCLHRRRERHSMKTKQAVARHLTFGCLRVHRFGHLCTRPLFTSR